MSLCKTREGTRGHPKWERLQGALPFHGGASNFGDEMDTDAHGWKKSSTNFSINGQSSASQKIFHFTEKRKQLMKQAVTVLHCDLIPCFLSEHWVQAAVLAVDMADMMTVINYLTEGNTKKAIERFACLDTAARDRFPQWFRELTGMWINPTSWKDEESLENTG